MENEKRLIELLKKTPIAEINGHIAYAETCFVPHVFANMAEFLDANGVTIVVQCKDCEMFCPEEIRKLYNTEKYCMRTGWVVKDDDFCSCGVRRNDDHNHCDD